MTTRVSHLSPRWSRAATTAAVFVAAWALCCGTLVLRGAREGDRFDFVRWEAQALPGKWLFALGRPLRHDPPADEALARYFALTDRNSPEALRLEGSVEATIDGHIDAVIHEAGVGWPVPRLLGSIFPPVNIELAGAPRVLVVSPRARIVEQRADTLRPDLTAGTAAALERKTEQDRSLSALVVPTGGIATYPAIVETGDSYEDTLFASAHEWTHHYLSLFPLGLSYFASNDARTINETVADVVGAEVSRLVLARYPLASAPAPQPAPPAGAAPAQPPPDLDVDKTLRDLRVEVDGLLAAGRIDAAEARMEQVRHQLDAASVHIRRINQAYFAWYGTYAARPDSIDPLGAQVRAVRQRAGSLAAFLAEIRAVRTRADVARLAGP